MDSKRASRYALRRTLPPWRFTECLDELPHFCQDASVDEVILKADVEEFSHGIPTIEWLEAYLPKMKKARDELKKIGVKFSINPWITVGHLDRGRDLRKIFPDFSWMVGHRGEISHAVACPLSEGWREHTKKLWQMYASLKPNVIWVEDDIRTFNHTPIDFGCFCENHIEMFNKRTGEKVSREKLVEAILKSGKPHPWRAVWLDLLRDVILDTCNMLAKTVHEVSPKTYLGLMSSGPAIHCAEGRDWKKLAEVLGEGKPIYSRPTLWNYNEGALTGLYDSARQIKRTRYVLPKGTIEQTEVENVPFTAFSKSASFTALQILISVSHGCDGATMNLFDHMGTPMSVDPDILEMLASHRKLVDALAESHCPPGVFKGVRILHNERAGYVRELNEGDTYFDLEPRDYAYEYALNALGITTTYDDSPIIAADGQMIASYSDDEIKKMLSGGLLLDLRASESLINRGFGKYLGFSIKETMLLHEKITVSAEELTDPEFGGAPFKYLTMTIPDLVTDARFGIIQPVKSARQISWLVDPDQKVLCGFTTLFENELGGRVAIIPLDMGKAISPGFLHPYRREQLLAVLQWLSHNRLPAFVSGGTYPLAYRMDFDDRIMLGVFSLCHDDWHETVWDVFYEGDEIPRKIEVVRSDGKWEAKRLEAERMPENRLRINLRRAPTFRVPVIIRLMLK